MLTGDIVNISVYRDECERTDIENGEIVPAESPGKYYMTCHEGFRMKGNETMICENGQWTMPVPRCIISRY